MVVNTSIDHKVCAKRCGLAKPSVTVPGVGAQFSAGKAASAAWIKANLLREGETAQNCRVLEFVFYLFKFTMSVFI